MNDFSEITVVGGGIIGLATAWELSKNGHQVRLIEASRWGSGSSWAGAGILPPAAQTPSIASEPIDQLRALSHHWYPEWTQELHRISKIDPEFSQCGGLYFARTLGEKATLMAQESHWLELGVRFDRMTLAEAIQRFPQTESILKFAQERNPKTLVWYLPEECTVRNPRLIQSLIAACKKNNVELIENCRTQRIDPDEVRIRIETDHGSWHSDSVCLCTGAWTQLLMSPLNQQTGILPVRGQMLLYKLPEPQFSMILNDGHRYFVPRRDGHVLAGSCEEEVGFDSSTTQEKIEELRTWVDSWVPSWNRDYFVRAWAGLRPGSFDGLPYLGRVPDHPRIVVAAGHFRSGLHLAPATARIVSSLLEDRTPPMDISAFHLNRGRTWITQ